MDLRTGVPEEDRVAEGGRWGPERTVRAAVIVALLLGANTAQPGAAACLRLAGARISGHLKLAGAQIAYALWLEDCWLEKSVDLLGASTQTIVITGSRVPGIEAYSACIEGTLDLRRSVVESLTSSPFNHVSTALSLSDARVAGGMLLNARIRRARTPSPSRHPRGPAGSRAGDHHPFNSGVARWHTPASRKPCQGPFVCTPTFTDPRLCAAKYTVTAPPSS